MARRRPLLVLLLLLAACVLPGCVEVEERWSFAADGGGSWRLQVRWNADILRRASDALGDEAMEKLAQPAFPMTKAEWSDLLASAPSLSVRTLEEEIEDRGWRRLTVELGFHKLDDLFSLEVLGGRKAKVETTPSEDGGRICRMEMEVLRAVPVLDPVAAILRAEENGTAAPEGDEPQDPPLLERLGLRRPDAERVWQLVGPRMADVRFSFVVETPQEVIELAGQPVDDGEIEARFAFDLEALKKPGTKRQISLGWRVGRIDRAPSVDNAGAGQAAEAGASGSR